MRRLTAAVPAPFLVFGIAAIGFVVWLAYDATAPAATSQQNDEPALPDDSFSGVIEASLGALEPGQPRLMVEQQLAEVGLAEVDPIDLSTGRPVCRSRYTVHLTNPIPNLRPSGTAEFTPGEYILTLEFDGATAGHPLSRIALAPAPAGGAAPPGHIPLPGSRPPLPIPARAN